MIRFGKLQQKQTALWLSALLFFNAFAPILLANRPVSASLLSNLSVVFGGKIQICTASGIQYIRIKDPQNGDMPDLPRPMGPHCPLCIVHALLDQSFLSGAGFVDRTIFQPVAVDFFNFLETAPQFKIIKYSASRGPPVFL